ncbi:MAG: oxygen-independent coproporphyrinogen III oxidase [Bacteroidota bacterium]
MNTQLIHKYNVPGPRYTSYPTVPYWDQTPPSEDEWQQQILQTYQVSGHQGISLYVHLPYCESLCTYCGCTTRITVNHRVEAPYIDTVLQEWKMYRQLLAEPPLIRELHLGGGTPTFFSPASLSKLVTRLIRLGRIDEETTMSLEAHPSSTTEEHLRTLYELGFRRLSLGIQDFDPEVQQTINRKQTYEQIATVVQLARQTGFTSINFDLIYGLPKQTLATVQDTIEKTIRLQPDRIAFYSYAHVPWMKPAQRSLEPFLPNSETKQRLYEQGKVMLQQAGYHEIGMDHFAYSDDPLLQASQQKKLHRNFMGYTLQATKMLIGLGASAISDTWTAFGQNVKSVEAYRARIETGKWAIHRGHILTPEDLRLREHILNVMCQMHTEWDCRMPENKELQRALSRLVPMAEDGLVNLTERSIDIPETGKPFLRNICMALDARLWRSKPQTNLFSSTV